MLRCRIVRLPALLLAVMIMLSAYSPACHAADSGDYTYTVSNNEAQITRYKGKGGAVSVPSRIEGAPVTTIGDSAFSGCTSITSLVLPSGIRGIGYSAFAGCTAITAVTLPYGLASIGDYAFMGCTGIAAISLPDSVNDVGYGAFAGCTSLGAIGAGAMNSYYSSASGVLYDKNMENLICCPAGRKGYLAVPEGVNAIGQEAFAGCAGLTGVSLPKSLSSIGYWAFAGCKALTGILLPDNLETIGASAFDGCAGLLAISIPGGVIDAGSSTFDGCTALVSIGVDDNNLTYMSRDGVLYDKSGIELIRCPEGRRGAYEIPDKVSIVSDWAFSGCANLTSITIPGSVFSIGRGAFVCGAAWAMSGSAATDAASLFTSFYVDDFNRYFSSSGGVLYNDTQSELISVPAGRAGSFTIPGGVAAIGDYAFACCTRLTDVVLPGTVSSIGGSAFAYCTGLKELTIPASVTAIGSEAFYCCSTLKKAYMENALTGMGADAFRSVADGFKVYYHVSLSQQWADFSAYAMQSYCFATVDYKDGSAAAKTAVDVTEARLTPPQAQTRAGYTFAGWFRDAALKAAWDFAKDEITGDVSLFAKWVTAAPSSLRAVSASYKSIALNWGAVPDVSGYELYRSAAASGKYTLVKATTATSFTNTNLTTGKTYYYRIRAYRMNGAAKEYGAYSPVVSARPGLSASRLSVSAASAGNITLAWTPVTGATKYEVWRCTASATGTYSLLASAAAASYTDTGLTAGKTFWYKVRAYRLVSGKKIFGAYSGVVNIKP